MKTLFIDCYLESKPDRLINYYQMIQLYSEVIKIRLEELSPIFDFSPYAAVVISGSEMMLSEKEPPTRLKEAFSKLKVPTLGICFGHQLLARAFGARIEKGEGKIERLEMIKFLEPWDIFAGLGKQAEMRESHQEYVVLASVKEIGWQVGADSSSCEVEAIKHPSLPIYGVQFHPERSGENGSKLFKNFFDTVRRFSKM